MCRMRASLPTTRSTGHGKCPGVRRLLRLQTGTCNGDLKLVLLCPGASPNVHSYARRWVTVDNVYCDGEVSEEDQQWSNAAGRPELATR